MSEAACHLKAPDSHQSPALSRRLLSSRYGSCHALTMKGALCRLPTNHDAPPNFVQAERWRLTATLENQSLTAVENKWVRKHLMMIRSWWTHWGCVPIQSMNVYHGCLEVHNLRSLTSLQVQSQFAGSRSILKMRTGFTEPLTHTFIHTFTHRWGQVQCKVLLPTPLEANFGLSVFPKDTMLD